MRSRTISVWIAILISLIQACNPTNPLPLATSTVPPLLPNTSAPTETDALGTPSGTSIIEEAPPPSISPENLEAIAIHQPGHGSSVSSPVLIEGLSNSTFEQNLVITISDEDGDVLVMQPTTIQTPLGERGPFSTSLEFTVASEQAGRISVFSLSALDGGVEHLSSVELRLLPGGVTQILGPKLETESIRIDAPSMSANVSGGILYVSGYSDYFFESNLGLALCGLGGVGLPHPVCGSEDNILASGFATIEAPDIGLPGLFSGQVEYAVTTASTARLVVYAASPRDGGLLHASSVVVTLHP